MANKHSNTQIFRYSLIGFLFFFLSCSTSAQSYSSKDKKAIKFYKQGQEFYNSHDLKNAEILLKKATEEDNNFVEAHTLLAYTYLDQQQYKKAKVKFEAAVNANASAIPNNLFFIGELELKDGNYSKAKKRLNQFLNTPNVDPKLSGRANRNLDKIHFALQAKSNPVAFEPINLGENINSEHSEYFPCMTVDNNTLLFTRRLPIADKKLGFNEDFFLADFSNGGWQKAQNIRRPINTSMNEGAPSLAPDGQTLIFTACELYGDYGQDRKGFGSCDLFYSIKNGKTFTNPINLGKAINSNHWETQPSFAADGKTLYFVRGKRDRSGTRTGDIYTSSLGKDGYWSAPQKLGPNINTRGNEESVFIHPNGKTLYFSSDGHLGMGGLDIFVVEKDEEGNWGKPTNLGYPINTFKNENSLLVSANGKLAYFASDRKDGFGGLDLYKFDMPKHLQPTAVTYFAGKIYDKETKQAIEAKFELIDLKSGDIVVESYSNKGNGEFLVSLAVGKDYALNVSKKGYLFFSENFALSENSGDEAYKKDVPLNPIKIGESIVLKNIFFETAKYDLKKSSQIELTKLKQFLTKNARLKIEVSGHTDNVGNKQNNQILSENRAKAVAEFLISNGIEASRISSKGYGDTTPIEDNNSEAGRAKNRRTEFKIIGL